MLRNFHPLAASSQGIVCVTSDDYVPFRTFRGYGVILIDVCSPDVANRRVIRRRAPPGRIFSPLEINRHVVIVTRGYSFDSPAPVSYPHTRVVAANVATLSRRSIK